MEKELRFTVCFHRTPEKRQTKWDVEPASPAKPSPTHTGVRRVKPIEAISKKINALVIILIIRFDMGITHADVV